MTVPMMVPVSAVVIALVPDPVLVSVLTLRSTTPSRRVDSPVSTFARRRCTGRFWRIGRITRRSALLLEYWRGRCRVRCRTGSGHFAVEVSGLGQAGNDESATGRRWAGAREVRRSVSAAHRWAQSARGSVMGRPGMRCGRTGRRSAGVVDGADLARGEMGEDSLDE